MGSAFGTDLLRGLHRGGPDRPPAHLTLPPGPRGRAALVPAEGYLQREVLHDTHHQGNFLLATLRSYQGLSKVSCRYGFLKLNEIV